ncbi:MAG: hypothetical protein N3F09_04390 [Bacteroidia bacterium]|nr:hypothetical protein [Bacteroidia bacterium]
MMRDKNYPNFLFWAFWILVLFSCSLEKRRYFKGYHICRSKQTAIAKLSVKEQAGEIKKPADNHEQAIILKNYSPEEGVLTIEADKNEVLRKHILYGNFSKKVSLLSDTCKDELIFKNGERLKVKLVEITPYVVRFYNCKSSTEYVSELPKSDLYMILPHNGKAEIIDDNINHKSTNSKSTSSIGQTNLHEEILIGLILLLTTTLVGAVFILIRYKAVRNEILSNPDKYHGLTLWDILFYFSIGCISIIALIFLFILVMIFSI